MENVMSLLIVDDETRFLETMAGRLRRRGFTVSTASNGLDAIALARREKFDVAVVDLRMPGMEGGQVLRTLKEEHRFLEVVILTGHGSIESAVELTKLGAHAYLPKPYELDKLIDVLTDAYETRLKKKYAADNAKLEKLTAMATGESPLAILRKLRELDDDRK